MIRRNLESECGFTLLELIFTLMLVGLLYTLSVPCFTFIGENMERELFLESLASDIQLAQMEAVSRQKEVIIHIHKTTIQVIQDAIILRESCIPIKYKITSNYVNNRLLFRKTGQIKGGTLQIIKGSKTIGRIKVQVSSGRPKVEYVFS